MTLLQRIAREPNAIVGVIVSAYGTLVAFGVLELTATQVGAVTALGGALVILLRWLVTPAGEVIASQPPGAAVPRAGAASNVETGAPVHVRVNRILGKA